MLRRPILLNRPLKPKKVSIYRPGAKPVVTEASGEFDTASPPGLKRTARLAEKLEECRAAR